MVPYFDSTDHHSFTPRHVGVPGTSLTNWPDQWIHSSGDDLESIDATQLERNAVVVAAVALYFASLADDDVAALAAYVAARGRARVAADTATAVAHLVRSKERLAAWKGAERLVRHTHDKEDRALASLTPLDRAGRAREIVSAARRHLEESRQGELRALTQAYAGLTGEEPPPPELDEEARKMAGTVYAPVADVAQLSRKLREVATPSGLHSLMKFEVLNFADGTRTAWEVYEAVAAQALSAGEWYYGGVTPANVRAVLDSAVKEGALEVKE
jgi:hypothetical protein